MPKSHWSAGNPEEGGGGGRGEHRGHDTLAPVNPFDSMQGIWGRGNVAIRTKSSVWSGLKHTSTHTHTWEGQQEWWGLGS